MTKQPKHAMITKDGFQVPLIGINPEAAIETCDCCHDVFGLLEIEYNGRQILCKKCRQDEIVFIGKITTNERKSLRL